MPESFKVVRTGYRDTPQSIYLNRDLLVEAWQLQKVVAPPPRHHRIFSRPPLELI